MDAGVVSDFRPQAFASRTAAESAKTGAGFPGAYLKSLGCRSQGGRRSRKSRRAAYGVGAPLRWTKTDGGPSGPPNPRGRSPSSRLLASGPVALATPPTPFFSSLPAPEI